MNRAEWQELNIKARTHKTLEDEKNDPIFPFALIPSKLVSRIAKGEINVQELAKRALESRGEDINGRWVGFGKEID